MTTIPKEVRGDFRVESIDDERYDDDDIEELDGDGVWINLRAGFISGEGTHTIHEWTNAGMVEALRVVEVCFCAECVDRLAGKPRAWPTTKRGAFALAVERDLLAAAFVDGSTAQVAKHYGVTMAMALDVLTSLVGFPTPAGVLTKGEADAGRRSGMSVANRPQRFRWFTT